MPSKRSATNADRARYYNSRGTSVAEQVGRGNTSLATRITVRVVLAVYRGVVWVHRKLEGSL
jgi:hypothetical protein